MNILLVEDEDACLESMSDYFAILGNKVTKSVNGSEAVKLLKSEKPFDLIISDFNMPVCSGMKLYECLTEMNYLWENKCPFIIFTGNVRADAMFHFGQITDKETTTIVIKGENNAYGKLLELGLSLREGLIKD